MLTVLLVLALLQTKHLLVDWVWQPPYEHQNKGTYGHWGGIRHALKNAIGTGLCLALLVDSAFAFWLAFLDFVIHYHIDWCKVNLNRGFQLCPTRHPQFWWLTGLDQYLHQVTYLGLVWYAVA